MHRFRRTIDQTKSLFNKQMWKRGLLIAVLIVIVIEVAWMISIWQKPMKHVIQAATNNEREFEVLQVATYEEEVVALLSVNEGDLGMARLHKAGLTFVLDELYEEQSLFRDDHMEVLVAVAKNRHYVVVKKTSEQLSRIVLMFAKTVAMTTTEHHIQPSVEPYIGQPMQALCDATGCAKQIDVYATMAWYEFDEVAMMSLLIVGVDDAGLIVSILIPDGSAAN